MNTIKTIIDLKQYQSPNTEYSHYKNIPINHLEITKKILKCHGYHYKIRYRGPRKLSIGDTRARVNRQSNCLKKFATTFTVYKEYS